jgi:putative spermidine/putrescine transport system substrate-binding protein
MDDSDAYAMEAQEVLYELDPANIPNLADTVPVLRRGYFVPWLYSGLVLIHTAAVVDPPRSYADLWDSRWAGRLGLTSQLYFNYMMMAALVLSGSTANTQAAKVRLTELKTTVRPRVYPTHEMLEAALANGDVDVAVSYKARGLQWAHDGMPVRMVYPDEGAIAITFGASMPRRASNVGAAYAYMDAMLDPTAMAGLASASFYAPANTRTPLSPELSRLIDFSPEERARLHVPDYAYVAANTAGWREWWDKSFAT